MKNPLEGIEAYPLTWPPITKRTPPGSRTRANFGRQKSEARKRFDGSEYTISRKESLTVGQARDRALAELGRLGARSVIMSSNVQLRQDGIPYSGRREPEDPGVAVYFMLNGKPRCLPCDRWDRVADNFAAIAKFVEAMRGQIRWGVGSVDAMFSGFKALPGSEPLITPEAMTVEQAAAFISQVINGGSTAAANIVGSSDTYKTCYRAAAKALHPDTNGGTRLNEWARLQQAAEVLDRHHG